MWPLLFEMCLVITEVASMTDHKSLSTLKRYTHIEAEKLQNQFAPRVPPTCIFLKSRFLALG